MEDRNLYLEGRIMKNNLVSCAVVLIVLAFSSSANAQLGTVWDDPDEPVEEIIVVAQIVDYGFGDMLGLIGLREYFQEQFLQDLTAALQYAQQASEAQCQQTIETWRGQCHTQMNVAAAGCALSGVLVFRSAIRARIPFGWREGIIGTGTGTFTFSCTQAHERSHLWCDDMADSDSAPTIAQCPGAAPPP